MCLLHKMAELKKAQHAKTWQLTTYRNTCMMDLGSDNKWLLISQREGLQTLSLSSHKTPPQGWSYVIRNLNPASSSKCQPKETREGACPVAPETQQRDAGGESCEATDPLSSVNQLGVGGGGRRGEKGGGQGDGERERDER